MTGMSKTFSNFFGRFAGVLVIVLLTACAPKGLEKQSNTVQLDLTPVAFADLPFWSRDRHVEALGAFIRSCPSLLGDTDSHIGGHRIKAEDWVLICRVANQLATGDAQAAQKFFENWFAPHLISAAGISQGLFTGYFEAELRGSRIQSPEFNVPLHGLPIDLVRVNLGKFEIGCRGQNLIGRMADGRILPYHRRGDIQKGALRESAPVLAWVDDAIDAFLLNVQGSGRVVLEDDAVMRVGYAGNNGHRYVSIGRVLIDQGELPSGSAGWTQIRNWMARHPSKAETLLARNPRYIFFREISGDGPIGAQGVALTPRRSLAVDRKFIPLGLPIWLDTVWPGQDERPLRRLMVAQDTGSAIKGPIRGDFFWGYGKDALVEAGRMKSLGQYYILLPKSAIAPTF